MEFIMRFSVCDEFDDDLKRFFGSYKLKDFFKTHFTHDGIWLYNKVKTKYDNVKLNDKIFIVFDNNMNDIEIIDSDLIMNITRYQLRTFCDFIILSENLIQFISEFIKEEISIKDYDEKEDTHSYIINYSLDTHKLFTYIRSNNYNIIYKEKKEEKKEVNPAKETKGKIAFLKDIVKKIFGGLK